MKIVLVIAVLMVVGVLLFALAQGRQTPRQGLVLSGTQVEQYRELASVLNGLLDRLEPFIQPGVSTRELDRHADRLMLDFGVVGYYKELHGMPHVITTSINEEVINTIPSDRRLEAGDLLKMQIGISAGEAYAYQGRTYFIAQPSEQDVALFESAHRALDSAIAQCRPGARVGEVSFAMDQQLKRDGFSANRSFVGHRMGEEPHMEPQIPVFGPGKNPTTGAKLRDGQIFAINVIAHRGSPQIVVGKDGWNITSRDGSSSVHLTHMVVVGDRPEILTRGFDRH